MIREEGEGVRGAILEADLASLMLNMAPPSPPCLPVRGRTSIKGMPWLDVPEDAAVRCAVDLLRMLGAVDEQCLATKEGGRMAR